MLGASFSWGLCRVATQSYAASRMVASTVAETDAEEQSAINGYVQIRYCLQVRINQGFPEINGDEGLSKARA